MYYVAFLLWYQDHVHRDQFITDLKTYQCQDMVIVKGYNFSIMSINQVFTFVQGPSKVSPEGIWLWGP